MFGGSDDAWRYVKLHERWENFSRMDENKNVTLIVDWEGNRNETRQMFSVRRALPNAMAAVIITQQWIYCYLCVCTGTRAHSKPNPIGPTRSARIFTFIYFFYRSPSLSLSASVLTLLTTHSSPFWFSFRHFCDPKRLHGFDVFEVVCVIFRFIFISIFHCVVLHGTADCVNAFTEFIVDLNESRKLN